jgi:methylamine dehydrogenase accessory protein MauD
MNNLWMISYAILWVFVVSLFVAVVALARQIGVILRRVGPSPARIVNYGPKIGDIAPRLDATSLTVPFGTAKGKMSLLVFVATSCSACDDLLPAVKRIWKTERKNIETIIISLNNDKSKNQLFIERHGIEDIPFIASRDLAIQYQVLSPPYGIVIDESNILRAKGIVNNIDHLESLLNAAEMRIPSIESYLKENQQEDAVFT